MAFQKRVDDMMAADGYMANDSASTFAYSFDLQRMGSQKDLSSYEYIPPPTGTTAVSTVASSLNNVPLDDDTAKLSGGRPSGPPEGRPGGGPPFGGPPGGKPGGGPPFGPAPEEGRSKAKTAIIMTALCVAVFLAAIDITIVTTALPTIAQHFRSPSAYTWIGSSYLLAAAASTPLWGKISDIFGRKPVLLIANVVFMVGSLLAGVSETVDLLIFGRVVQGVGGGGLIVLVNICIGDLFSIKKRGAYFGLVGGVWAISSATGPLIGGAFAEGVSWRWCFYINLPLDGIAFVIIVFFLDRLHVPNTPIWKGLKAIDWLGAISIVGATLMILLGLEFGGESAGWGSAKVICLLVFGVVVLVFFGLNEWRIAPYPVIPLHIFRFRSNMACLAVCFFHGFTFIGGSFYLPLYFQACLGASPIMSGVYTLSTALSLSLASMATGFIIRKTGAYLPSIICGTILMTLGYGLFISLEATANWPKIICFQIISGLGVGQLFQSPLIALQTLVPKGDIAAATATFQFTRNIGTAVGVVVGSVVFQNTMKPKEGALLAAIGEGRADELAGFNAAASVHTINELPDAQKLAARVIFASSFKDVWIVYCVFAALGLLSATLITKQKLEAKHETTKTGLEAEEEKRRTRLEERRSRRLSKQSLKEAKALANSNRGSRWTLASDVPPTPTLDSRRASKWTLPSQTDLNSRRASNWSAHPPSQTDLNSRRASNWSSHPSPAGTHFDMEMVESPRMSPSDEKKLPPV